MVGRLGYWTSTAICVPWLPGGSHQPFNCTGQYKTIIIILGCGNSANVGNSKAIVLPNIIVYEVQSCMLTTRSV